MHTLVTGEVCQRCGRPHLRLRLIAIALVKPASSTDLRNTGKTWKSDRANCTANKRGP
jgi:hypothetical protein